MVDKSSKITTLGGVNDVLNIDSEEIRRTNSNFLVVGLPEIRNDGPDGLPHVLYDHLVRRYVFHRKQTPVVNTGLAELK